jgi:hypothetical protein
MSKSKAIGAILGALALLCVPAVAMTTSSEDEVLIRLAGANQVSPLHYTVGTGRLVALGAEAHPGDLMFIFAVAMDQWGEPDYGHILTVYLGYPAGGSFAQLIEIPAGLEGQIFQIQVVTQDARGNFASSNQLTISVLGVQVLPAPTNPSPTDPFPKADPAHLARPASLLEE